MTSVCELDMGRCPGSSRAAYPVAQLTQSRSLPETIGVVGSTPCPTLRPIGCRASAATSTVVGVIQDPGDYLVTLARQNAQIYLAQCGPSAILLTGSSASGSADFYSDIDIIVYYAEALPAED